MPEDSGLLCPLRYTLGMVGGKWKLPILCLLADGEAVRYSAIKRKVPGITNMMLSQSLKELEEGGLVHRKQYNEIPPKVEYTLAQEGKSLLPVLAGFSQWGNAHMKKHNTGSSVCRQCKATE